MGLWNKILLRQCLAAIANLVLDVIFIQTFGVTGVVFASFLTCLLISLPMDIYITHKFVLNDSILKAYCGIASGYLLLFLIGGLTYFICSFINLSGIIGLVIRAIICLILPNILMTILFRRTDPFKNVVSHFKGLVQIK